MIKLLFLIFIIKSTAIDKKNPDKTPIKKENEIELISKWSTNSQGKQFFIINNKTKGELQWDFKKNTWLFVYEKYSLKIENKKIIKIENGKEKKYSCIGIAKLLQHNIDTWGKYLKNKKQESKNQQHTFMGSFENIHLIFIYESEPFKLINIFIIEGNNSYHFEFI